MSDTWLMSVDAEKTEGKILAIGTLDNKILITDINNNNSTGFKPFKEEAKT